MTTTKPELKACPLCPGGGKPYKSDAANESNDSGGRMVYVGCANCGVHLKAANYLQMDGSWKMSKDIVSVWNTRPEKCCGSVGAEACMKEDRTGAECPANKVLEGADTREDSGCTGTTGATAASTATTSSTSKQPVIDDGLREALKECLKELEQWHWSDVEREKRGESSNIKSIKSIMMARKALKIVDGGA